MSVRSSIFGSNSEERGFRSIEDTFGEKYRVIPQFPWSALFTPKPNWQDTSNLFFKTSVDYLVATKEGKPLCAIDFDGMGSGYDSNGEYVQVEPTKDRNRKATFDFKLRYAQENWFPYHIVASEEFNQLGEGIDLTLVHCLIAAVTCNRLSGIITEQNPHLFSDPYEVIDLWTEPDFNPVVKKLRQVGRQIEELTGGRFYGFHSEYIMPVLPPDLTSWVAVLKNTPVGEVSDVVTVRGGGFVFRCELGDVARFLAYSKLLRLLKK